MDYRISNALTELNNDILNLEGCLKLWQSVTFPTKKDGKPFAILSKNIEGAKIITESWRTKGVEDSLHVWGSRADGHYIPSGFWACSLDLYASIESDKYGTRYMNERDLAIYQKSKQKPQNVRERGAWVKDAYVFDLEDIKEAVAQRVTDIKDRLRERKEQLANCEKVFDEFLARIKALKADLETATNRSESSTLYYIVADALKKEL